MSSLRQKLAVQKLSENIRNSKGGKGVSMGKVLREAGYSKQTSLKPKLVTETKGFKDELSKVIPDESLAKVQAQLLHAVKLNKFSFDSSISNVEIKKIIEGMVGCKVREIARKESSHKAVCYYWSPDRIIIDKALDSLYRINGYYHSDKQPTNDAPIEVRIINYGEKI